MAHLLMNDVDLGLGTNPSTHRKKALASTCQANVFGGEIITRIQSI